MASPRGRNRPGRTVTWVAALALMLVVAGCGNSGGSEDGTVELRYTWWGNAERAELQEEAVALFEKEHPNIKVSTSFSEYTSYWQKLSTEAAGGGAPDVMQMDYTYLREYGDRGVLADLGEQTGENLDVEGVLPELRASGEIEGTLYAIPIGRNLFSFQYDPELWEAAGLAPPEAGWTWQEYMDAALKVNQHTGGEPAGTVGFGQHLNIFELWVRQHGKALYTENGELNVTPEDLRSFWELETEFLESGAAISQFPTNPAATRLAEGKVVSEVAWDNFLSGTSTTLGKELAVAPFPSVEGGETGPYFKPSMLLSISSRSEHPEEAAMLIDFMINSPEAGAIFGVDRGMPVTPAQQESLELEGVDQAIQEFQKSVEANIGETPPPPPKGASTIERMMLRVSEEFRLGRITLDQAVERWFEEAEAALEQAS